MQRTIASTLLVSTIALAAAAAPPQSTAPPPVPGRQRAMPPEKFAGGYVLERDADVAREEPGTHKGGGQTIGYSFFKDTPKLAMVFRKRALKPGSAIGYHEQNEDEIYYVLSGRGIMTIDGKPIEVGPGTAVLTRPGSSHGLKQVGNEDLVIMINYLQQPKNQRSGFTSSSARTMPLPYSPPVSEISVMRSNISIGGNGNCALPGPNSSPRPQASKSSYS